MSDSGRRGACVFCALLIIAGCASNSEESQGKTIGQVAGGVIAAVGGYVGGRAAGLGTAGRVVAAVAAGAAGAWIGGEIASYLSEGDREEMTQATQEAAVTGDTTSWKNSETGVSGQAQVVNTETTQTQVAIPVLKDRIKKVPPLDLIGEPYQSNSEVNVRGGPGSDYVVVDTLRKGEVVTVAGKVQGQPWYMISQNGAGSGFVHADLLAPAPKMAVPPPVQSTKPATGATATQTVAASRTCRTVKQTITLADGSEHEEEVRACQGPNGWEVI